MPRSVDELLIEIKNLSLQQHETLGELDDAIKLSEFKAKKGAPANTEEWKYPVGIRVRVLKPPPAFPPYFNGRSSRKVNEFGVVIKNTKYRVHIVLDSGKIIQRAEDNIALVR